MRNVSDKMFRENKNIFYVQKLFSINHAVYGIMCQNIVDREWLQKTKQQGACTLHAE
jgi:hypothetical protein